MKTKRSLMLLGLTWIVLYALFVGPAWVAAKRTVKLRAYSPFEKLTGPQVARIWKAEGFADHCYDPVDRTGTRVLEVPMKSNGRDEDKNHYSFQIEVDSKPINIKVEGDALWAGLGATRALVEKDSISLIYNACGDGRADKFDRQGRLLFSVKVLGHSHSVGVLAPRKRWLCLGNNQPYPPSKDVTWKSQSRIHIFNWETGEQKCVFVIPPTESGLTLAVSHDERYLYVGVRSKSYLRLELP